MSYLSRVYRQRNAHTHDELQQQPFFSKQNDINKSGQNSGFFQAKLAIGKPGDKYEQEADAVANAVVNRQTGNAPVKKEDTLEICAFMEAADESRRVNGGTVNLDEIWKRASKEAQKKLI